MSDSYERVGCPAVGVNGIFLFTDMADISNLIN